jgi:hypothetical protein
MGPLVRSRHLSGLRIAFKHRRHGYFQNTANAEQPRRADPVLACFILLNLLFRDVQGLRDVFLAHFECVPTRAHSFTNISINGGCLSGRVLFAFWFFHTGTGEAGLTRSGSKVRRNGGGEGTQKWWLLKNRSTEGGLIFGLPPVRGT